MMNRRRFLKLTGAVSASAAAALAACAAPATSPMTTPTTRPTLATPTATPTTMPTAAAPTPAPTVRTEPTATSEWKGPSYDFEPVIEIPKEILLENINLQGISMIEQDKVLELLRNRLAGRVIKDRKKGATVILSQPFFDKIAAMFPDITEPDQENQAIASYVGFSQHANALAWHGDYKKGWEGQLCSC